MNNDHTPDSPRGILVTLMIVFAIISIVTIVVSVAGILAT